MKKPDLRQLLSRAVDEDLDAAERLQLAEAMAKDPALAAAYRNLKSLGPLLRDTFPDVQPPLRMTLKAMRIAQPKPTRRLLPRGVPFLVWFHDPRRLGLVAGFSGEPHPARHCVGRRRVARKRG